MPTITALRQAVKNTENVNIDLDGVFWINISKNLLLEYGLFKGMEIAPDQKQSLEELASINKLIEKVRAFVLIRPRSIREVLDYLRIRRKVLPDIAKVIVDKLISTGELDDYKFAQWFCENRLAGGKSGVNKIKMELIKKGVGNDIIKIVMRDLPSDASSESLDKLIEKFSKNIKAKDKRDFEQKLIRRLLSRGFGYEEIRKRMSKG